MYDQKRYKKREAEIRERCGKLGISWHRKTNCLITHYINGIQSIYYFFIMNITCIHRFAYFCSITFVFLCVYLSMITTIVINLRVYYLLYKTSFTSFIKCLFAWNTFLPQDPPWKSVTVMWFTLYFLFTSDKSIPSE